MSILNKKSFKNFYLQFVFKGFIADIFQAYKGLRASFELQLYRKTNESKLLAYSFFISIILFLQRLPSRFSQNPQYFDDINFNDRIGIDLFSSIFLFQFFCILYLSFFIFLVCLSELLLNILKLDWLFFGLLLYIVLYYYRYQF